MIRAFRWDVKTRLPAWLDSEAFDKPRGIAPDRDAIWWVDLEAPTEAEERRILHEFVPVHPLTLEDVQKPRRDPGEWPHLPKVEEFQDYLFVIVNPLRPGLIRPEGGLESVVATQAQLLDLMEKSKGEAMPELTRKVATRQLSALLTHNALITHHYDPLPSVAGLRSHLEKHPHAAERGPDYLFHLVLDAMVDEYAPVLDELVASLDAVETRVFVEPSPELLARLLKAKRTILGLRKTLTLEREVLARLFRGEFEMIDAKETAYYRNVYDHLVRYTELIEGAREMVSDLMQTHLAAASNRLSAVMKVLTMISTVVLPMTLVAGIYGMNFEENVVPDFKSSWGFPAAIGTMLALALGAIGFFRWKRWL